MKDTTAVTISKMISFDDAMKAVNERIGMNGPSYGEAKVKDALVDIARQVMLFSAGHEEAMVDGLSSVFSCRDEICVRVLSRLAARGQ